MTLRIALWIIEIFLLNSISAYFYDNMHGNIKTHFQACGLVRILVFRIEVDRDQYINNIRW